MIDHQLNIHTEENETGSEKGGRNRVATLPHGKIDDRDSEGTEEGRHCAESDVRDLVVDVGITNVVELEVAIEADEPAHEGEKEFSERWMDIEEVGSLEVLMKDVSMLYPVLSIVGDLSYVRMMRTIAIIKILASPSPSIIPYQRYRIYRHTFPKWTSSNTTSLGWLSL